MWVYRGVMLVWALWLAFAMLKWLKWGWACFSEGGLWKPLRGKIIQKSG
jgi:ABC-type Na+ efflux pump permease subunit